MWLNASATTDGGLLMESPKTSAIAAESAGAVTDFASDATDRPERQPAE